MFFLMIAVLSTYNMFNLIAVAQVSIQAHGDVVLGEQLVLQCQVTSFASGASWSHDNGVSLLTQCFNGGICTDTGSGNYQYTSDINGINVTIVSLTSDEQGITWTCTHSTYDASYTVPKPSVRVTNNGLVGKIWAGNCNGCLLYIVLCITVLFLLILKKDNKSDTWKSVPYFSSEYYFRGNVVYGIQIIILAAAIQTLSITVTAVVLSVYKAQYDTFVIIIFLLLIPVYSLLSVGLYIIILIAVNYCGCCKGRGVERIRMYLSISADRNYVNEGECVHLTCTVPDFKKTIFVVQDNSTRSVCLVNDASTATDNRVYAVEKEGSNKVKFIIKSFLKERDAGSWLVRYGTNDVSSPVTLSASLEKQKRTGWLVIFIVLPIAWLVLLWLIWMTYKNSNQNQDGKRAETKIAVILVIVVLFPLLWILLDFLIWKHLKTISIKTNKETIQDGDCVYLTCTVPDFKNTIFVVQDNSTRSVCLANDVSTATDNHVYTVEKKENNVVKFTIKNFLKERDAGSWLVRYGTFVDSKPVTLSAFYE